MNFICQHILDIINQFDGANPLTYFLKDYFKQHKNIGSRDRKAISEGVYIYYRSALFLPANDNPIEIIKKGYLLCDSNNSLLANKLAIVSDSEIGDIFAPDVQIPLSTSIDFESWLKSHWKQPDLYIRIVQNETLVIDLLKKNNVPFTIETFTNLYKCISIPNGYPVDKILLPEDYVVQDKSSQLALLQAFQYLQNLPNPRIWDVCAGAGGKSLLLQQLFNQQAQIIGSDIRKSILFNLKNRCHQYQMQHIKPMVIDATNSTSIAQQLKQKMFDLVLCDVPCSGSGTWSRTPEQLFFFDEQYFDQFKHLQLPILSNASKYVKQNGYLAYITCSVFEHENETVINNFLTTHPAFACLESTMITGYHNKADSLFVTILQKNK